MGPIGEYQRIPNPAVWRKLPKIDILIVVIQVAGVIKHNTHQTDVLDQRENIFNVELNEFVAAVCIAIFIARAKLIPGKPAD